MRSKRTSHRNERLEFLVGYYLRTAIGRYCLPAFRRTCREFPYQYHVQNCTAETLKQMTWEEALDGQLVIYHFKKSHKCTAAYIRSSNIPEAFISAIYPLNGATCCKQFMEEKKISKLYRPRPRCLQEGSTFKIKNSCQWEPEEPDMIGVDRETSNSSRRRIQIDVPHQKSTSKGYLNIEYQHQLCSSKGVTNKCGTDSIEKLRMPLSKKSGSQGERSCNKETSTEENHGRSC